MRSLYFKIFIWFWLAMALVGTAFVISTVTTQTGESNSRWRPLVGAGLTANGQRAIDIYNQGGQEGLVVFLDRFEDRTNIRAYLFDPSATELSGRELPEGGASLVAEAARSMELAVRELDDDDRSRLVALQVTTPDSDSYVVLAEVRRPFRAAGGRSRDGYDGRRGGSSGGQRGGGDQPGDFRRGGRGDGGFDIQRSGPPAPWYGVWMSAVDRPGALAFRLLAVFLTAGLVCYALACHLTAPVQRLRAATHQFAGGDLSARVGPHISGRRDELNELGRDFDQMAERIESLLTTQRRLLSDVSHELRSPLARLNVALAMARQRSGEEAQGSLDRIETEAEQLNQMIGQVLVLARLESGAGKPAPVAVDLARLVADVAADADFEAGGRDSSVRISASEPCTVQGTEQLLRSAVENVVRNAVRCTADGSDVDIALAKAGGEAVITVRDHGPGIPEEHLEGIFQPFYRIEDSRDRESGGTGLGLAITDRAVRLHGGTVAASNGFRWGGLVVELRLPL